LLEEGTSIAGASEGDEAYLAEHSLARAVLLRMKGELARAEVASREALAMKARSVGRDHPTVTPILRELGGILIDQGRSAEAEPLLREATAISTRKFGQNNPRTAAAQLALGVCLTSLGRFAEAEAELTAAHRILAASLGATHEQAQEAEQALAKLPPGLAGESPSSG
jgi:serine/threonine-protein kinase